MNTPKSSLEQLFFSEIEKGTPDQIKNNCLIDISNPDEFSFVLRKEHLLKNITDSSPLQPNETRHPDGLGLYEWFKNYRKEAMVSTAGIRGPQNPLYPWDTRYPINYIGVMLATLAKALVAKDLYPDTTLYKIAASEVRYNSAEYVEIIARIQASYQIQTLLLNDHHLIPIWLTSFLIFNLDLYGGEYVTASHAISKKIATKDLNYQGSQYIPETTKLFINKIEQIFKEVEVKGSYRIKFSTKDNSNINQEYLAQIENGIPLYVEYLKKGIATDYNLNLIKSSKLPIVVDCEGGSMAETIKSINEKLGIENKFTIIHSEKDPFFHGIGKFITTTQSVNDYGCDATIMYFNDDQVTLPVIETMDYSRLLKEYPIKTKILIADPDGDRLVTTEIEPIENIEKLKQLGIAYYPLDDTRILAVYTPNQSFLMTFDFQTEGLKKAGLWDKYDWFMIKTTASAMTWDEWAKANNIPVFNTPVGFKEISTAMQKVENLMETNPDQIETSDVFGNMINFGKTPRLLFAGEESGGEIFGPSELIQSKSGIKAISMREKSAGEAILITSALASFVSEQNLYLSDYLLTIFEKNHIQAQYDVRVDIKYYNENESDIAKLLSEKEKGITLRTQNDLYFRSIALMIRNNSLTLNQARDILTEGLPQLEFTDLTAIYFVGDGTYLRFSNKFVEVRPSGTDAINKAYASANTHAECVLYAQTLGAYSGQRNPLHIKLISNDFYSQVPSLSLKLLSEYQMKDLPINKYIPRNRIN